MTLLQISEKVELNKKKKLQKPKQNPKMQKGVLKIRPSIEKLKCTRKKYSFRLKFKINVKIRRYIKTFRLLLNETLIKIF